MHGMQLRTCAAPPAVRCAPDGDPLGPRSSLSSTGVAGGNELAARGTPRIGPGLPLRGRGQAVATRLRLQSGESVPDGVFMSLSDEYGRDAVLSPDLWLVPAGGTEVL